MKKFKVKYKDKIGNIQAHAGLFLGIENEVSGELGETWTIAHYHFLFDNKIIYIAHYNIEAMEEI